MDMYVYQYFVGGIVFLGGIYFSWRQGFVGLHGVAFRNLILLFLGFAAYMGIQGYMEYGAMSSRPPVAYTGDGIQSGVRGQPLDYAIMVGYFLIILGIGTWFGRMQKSTKDFFFGGQKFAWWLVAFSLVATTIGSYSFVKYSKIAYQYGLSSSQTYMNDWFWLPWFIFGWLPIIYFSRVVSIPEYFERRFNRQVRAWATGLILVYLIGYVGVNLFTMGKALHTLLGWQIFPAAVLVAAISAVYVTAGGQTSVIMTDLFQGVMLLATGILILYLGADYLGGLDGLWENLPRDHRRAFPNFNSDPSFNGVGIFWQDAMANSAMFYFLNQGVMMRFMAARSVEEGRKAALVVPVLLMPIAACVVASGGWVGKALENAGVLPPDMEPASVFFIASEFLCSTPGLFGLIMAALTAALMSTVDTLITAVAAIIVNDVYKPYVNPKASDRDLLKVARITSVGVTLLGIALVPVFMMFDSIYAAHGAFTAAVTPPLVVTLLFSVFCRRFTAKAATWTLAGGMGCILASIVLPELIAPFAHGIPMESGGDRLLDGARQYKYIRAFFGLSVSTLIAVVVMFFTRPESPEKYNGLVWGTIPAALKRYMGSNREPRPAQRSVALPKCADVEAPPHGEGQLSVVSVSESLAAQLELSVGDLLYICDQRWWLGGLRSAHAVVGSIEPGENGESIILGPDTFNSVVSKSRHQKLLEINRFY